MSDAITCVFKANGETEAQQVEAGELTLQD